MVTRPRVVQAPPRRKPAVRLVDVRVLVLPDPDADPSYLDEPDFAERRAEYERGDFGFVGVVAEADVEVEGVEQRVKSGGLWGVESDDREHIEHVAGEEYDELRQVLKTLGVPTSELPTELDRRKIEWRN